MVTALALLAQAGTSGAAGTGLAIWLIVIVGIGLLASVFWLWMLVDCLTSSLPATEKLVWAIVIIFLHLLGAILYFALPRARMRRTA